jgi:hypothetical protein
MDGAATPRSTWVRGDAPERQPAGETEGTDARAEVHLDWRLGAPWRLGLGRCRLAHRHVELKYSFRSATIGRTSIEAENRRFRLTRRDPLPYDALDPAEVSLQRASAAPGSTPAGEEE